MIRIISIFLKKKLNFKNLVVWCCILFNTFILAQNDAVIISGVVTDNFQQSITNVTLIALPKQQNLKATYAITDTKGFYKLQLIKGASYNLSISHLGYGSMDRVIFFLENTSNYNITLNTKSEPLDEVVINYKYQPIEKSKDTLTYNLKAFTTGNELKMKDVLEKLPGVKVDDNVIKVQGKTVTKLLIEGKPFFDGSTKLAIENIPADVMDRIQIISDYKDSELLRNLADNEDLALNVVLKEDKKDFVFGDIEASLGLDEFYSLHPALFKYNPKSNISFIADINNYNKSSLDFGDLSRLVGGSSNLFKKNDLTNNLLNAASSNDERFESLARFSALNFQHELNKKFKVSGYAIYSNNDIVNNSLSIREYLGSDESIFETRNDFRDTGDTSAILNLKIDFNPNAKQKWMYNINYLNNTSNSTQESLSTSESTSEFLTKADGKGGNFSHNLEGYLKLNENHTIGVGLHHSSTNSNSTENWSSDTIFLQDYLPLNTTTNYLIKQRGDISAEKFNLILKDYWLANRNFHLFYNVGYNYKSSMIRSNISQVLSDNSILDFSELSNNNPFTLSDLNFGLGIKTKLEKFEIILDAKPHFFSFSRAQINSANFFISPKLKVNYQIDDDIDLDFDYDFTNNYLNDLSYLQNIRVTGFNSVLLGNPNLEDERSHNFSLFYSNYKHIDDYFIDASADYSINNPVKNNSVIQTGINQLNMPVILNLPQNNLSFNTDFGFIFNKSSVEFGIDLDWLKANQIINEKVNFINTFDYNLSGKWLLKFNKKTQLSLKYRHSGYHVNSGEKSQSTENTFSLNFDSKFLKNFIFKTDSSTHIVNDFSENTQNYTLQNLYLGYSKPNSKLSYSLNFRNIYNNGVIVRNSFSNNLLLSNQIFTIPRVLLFELKYKF
ncbi:carboxypeptidase-like regulatory domain-containing protein [Flavobacterium aureirubrum]|uniref:carboxypeptidase-like regulatory domain-containing protein n=1 Tax=Flavobacterium aureirubrum TaxID=3133147 RepID=UPI0031841D78